MSVEVGAWIDPLFLCHSIFHRRVSRFQILKNNYYIFVVASSFYFLPRLRIFINEIYFICIVLSLIFEISLANFLVR